MVQKNSSGYGGWGKRRRGKNVDCRGKYGLVKGGPGDGRKGGVRGTTRFNGKCDRLFTNRIFYLD